MSLTLNQFAIRFLKLSAIVGCIYGLVIILSTWFEVRYQVTESIPGVLYFIVKNKTPQKGDLAAFWPPLNKYYTNTCFIKYVKGVAGDKVARRGQQFFINGEFIGEAKMYSLKGDLLVPIEEGPIFNGHYFMWTPHKDSYDSRYKDIGTISSGRIIGTAYRLL